MQRIDNFITFATSNNKNNKIMAKTSKRVKVGTRIEHTLFGGGRYEGVVQGIEKCANGSKYGKPVSSMSMDKRSDSYVLDLDNGHWCYGSQVLSVIK